MSEADKHPPVLRAMLLGAGDDPEARDVIVRSYYGGMEGARHSVAVYQAVTLGAVYNAVRRDLAAATGQIAKHLVQSATEQGELTRKELATRFEGGSKDEQAEREKHLRLLREHAEAIRRESIALAEAQAQSGKNPLTWHVLTALIAFLVGFAACFWWDGQYMIKPAQTPVSHAPAPNR